MESKNHDMLLFNPVNIAHYCLMNI